jgi:transcription-repair coupling factor (superfamily II helicase)
VAHPLLLEAFEATPEFRALGARIPEPGSVVRVAGLAGSAPAVLAAALARATAPRPLVLVAADAASADELHADLANLLDGPVHLFPQRERPIPELGDEPQVEIAARRVEALEALCTGRARAVVVPARALAERFPIPGPLAEMRTTVRVGDERRLLAFVETLERMGYERVPLVEALGEFSVRGGIVDVFPITTADPVRIEFFDDRIESIRTFDVFGQRSVATREAVELLPVRLDAAARTDGGEPERRALVELWPASTLVVRTDPARETEERAHAWRELETRTERPHAFQLAPDDVERRLEACARVEVAPAPPADVVFRTRPPEPIDRDLPRLAEFIERAAARGERVYILCDNEGQIQRLEEILAELGEPALARHATFALGPLAGGFTLENATPPLHVLTDHEIFRRARRFAPRRAAAGTAFDAIATLRPGDYVVHVDHGIGRFRGLERITVGDQPLETLVLEYAGGEILRVPYYRADLVERWSSGTLDDGDRPPPRLDRLGGRRWAHLKRRAKNAIATMAAELLELYASRQLAPGHAFSPDTRWQRELESSFPYEETPDQAAAAEQVKRDMERPRPMDRLLCGDAGYGKTEVAVRAAFKAVQDGKQVAVLAPTTVLVEQHLRTFRQRLAGFPVRVEALSRFRTPREQRAILHGLAAGTVDIVIGTHRLLQRDVRFKDLGLLIIDEEQRFGVRQKERLKEMKRSVDALAMTATPIPRTLHLSLSGLRDLSLIRTPPRERRPILTQVVPWVDDWIRDAIRLELDRGGQVYVLHNRVESIDAVAAKVRALVPDARVAVAHGQLPAPELERVMADFLDGRVDVLVATTIIENGLDVPNANTMIVNRADRFGLAQLYQLRGRVGRSRHRAYCYLVVPPDVHPDAEARLRTLEHHTELGAGYRIALADLELRGAGNLLGPEQSGFAHAVGFEFYLRLLEETVREMKAGGPTLRAEPPEVTVHGPAYLPEGYVPDPGQKLQVYRRISRLADLDEWHELRDELRDRYGRWPPEVDNLLAAAQLRLLGARAGAERILVGTQEARIAFRPGALPRLAALRESPEGTEVQVEVRRLQPLVLVLRAEDPEALLPLLAAALERLATREPNLQPTGHER